MSTMLTHRKAKDDDGTYIVFDAWVPECGRTFFGVAFIFKIASDNPLISIPKPLGINAVKEILEHALNR